MKMPHTIGLVHFIGIGGIGMSGIAEVLHNLGYRVQGSDQADGANVQRLREKGIECFVGHRAENLGDAEVVVVSTAIRKSNPELIAAREKLLPVVRRAEMLAELMRFRQAVAIGGTHGKTTTTSMVAALLEAGGLDPTVINGGIINAYGTNARMGDGEWMVVEADESDGTFLKLPADIAVVTNIDPEHLDHYGSFDQVREAFRKFVENVPFYGFGVMCTDHPEVQALVGRSEDRRVVTYGGNGSERDARSIAFDKSSTALQQRAQEAFRDSQNIPPTIYVDQGTPVVVFVRRDLDFSALYADPVQEELARLKRGGKPKTAIDPTPLFMTPKDHYYPGYFPPRPVK